MIAPVCQHARRRTNGKTKAGTVRYRCLECGKSFTACTKQLDGMRIGLDRAAQIINMLCEGMSVRGTSRLTNTDEETILDLLILVGERCKQFLAKELYAVPVKEVQCDEIWGFVGMKQKTANRQGLQGEPVGDAYCFTALERDTKLLVAWHLGRRDDTNTDLFCEKLQDGTAGHFHVSTDGFTCYPGAMYRNFGATIEYGVIIKIFGKLTEMERRRYSPPKIKSIEKDSIIGRDSADKACTSHVERHNGSIRLFTKRMGRLTYCFSKKWENHEAALALFFAFYNFCRPHSSLKVKGGKPPTPAMASGLADHVWTVAELLAATADS